MKIRLIIAAIIAVAISSCNSLTGDTMSWGEASSTQSGSSDGVVSSASSYIAISNTSGDVDYAIVGDDGSAYLYTFQDAAQSVPEQLAVYEAGSSSVDMVISFDDYGVPCAIAADDYTIVFSNVEDDSFDAAVVSGTGSIQLYEDLPIDFDWSNYDSILSSASQVGAYYGAATRASYVSKVQLWWINEAVRVISTAIRINVTIDIQISLTIISEDGSIGDIADIVEDVVTSDTTASNDPIFDNYPFFRNVYSSTNVTIINIFISVVIDITVIVDNSQNDIAIAESALSTGIGDIKVTLSWTDYADIDLHVIDPTGTRICYYNTTSSTTGGWLDRDDTVGGSDATENIYFESSYDGTYYVYVHYYDTNYGIYTVDYQVAIFVNGQTINNVALSPITYTDGNDWHFIMQFEIQNGSLVSSSTIEPDSISYDTESNNDELYEVNSATMPSFVGRIMNLPTK